MVRVQLQQLTGITGHTRIRTNARTYDGQSLGDMLSNRSNSVVIEDAHCVCVCVCVCVYMDY